MTDLLVCGQGRAWHLNADTDKWRVILDQERHFTFGATFSSKDIFLGLVKNMGKDGIFLLRYNEHLQPISEEKLDLPSNCQPHQMYYNPNDNKLYWTMAQRGAVYVKDMSSGEWTWWSPADETYDKYIERLGEVAGMKRRRIWRSKLVEDDKERSFKPPHHINSIWFDDDDNAVLMSMNRGPSEILLCFGRELASRVRVGRACHSVWGEKGDILFCNSGGTGAIETISNKQLTPNSPCWARGVAYVKGERFIAMSHKGRVKTDRELGSSHIICMDEDWNTTKIIDLPFKGEVYEIRALAVDQCHNRIAPPGSN